MKKCVQFDEKYFLHHISSVEISFEYILFMSLTNEATLYVYPFSLLLIVVHSVQFTRPGVWLQEPCHRWCHSMMSTQC